MSFWEPRWVRKRFESHGITIVTCYDIVTSLIVCPICSSVSVDELCPENRDSSIVVTDAAFFITIEDLINHMRTHWHTKRYKKIKVPTSRELSEEGEESILRKLTNIESSSKRR